MSSASPRPSTTPAPEETKALKSELETLLETNKRLQAENEKLLHAKKIRDQDHLPYIQKRNEKTSLKEKVEASKIAEQRKFDAAQLANATKSEAMLIKVKKELQEKLRITHARSPYPAERAFIMKECAKAINNLKENYHNDLSRIDLETDLVLKSDLQRELEQQYSDQAALTLQTRDKHLRQALQDHRTRIDAIKKAYKVTITSLELSAKEERREKEIKSSSWFSFGKSSSSSSTLSSSSSTSETKTPKSEPLKEFKPLTAEQQLEKENAFLIEQNKELQKDLDSKRVKLKHPESLIDVTSQDLLYKKYEAQRAKAAIEIATQARDAKASADAKLTAYKKETAEKIAVTKVIAKMAVDAIHAKEAKKAAEEAARKAPTVDVSTSTSTSISSSSPSFLARIFGYGTLTSTPAKTVTPVTQTTTTSASISSTPTPVVTTDALTSTSTVDTAPVVIPTPATTPRPFRR